MYARQDKNQLKIGYSGYGSFGQVPQTTTTFTVGSTKVSITGPAHEMGPASSIVGMLNSATSAVQKGQAMEAQGLLQNARAMLPSTGSLRSKVEPLVAAAESQISGYPMIPEAYNPYNAPGIEGMLARAGIPPIIAFGGAGLLVVTSLILVLTLNK